jgi:hypothetical protein
MVEETRYGFQSQGNGIQARSAARVGHGLGNDDSNSDSQA